MRPDINDPTFLAWAAGFIDGEGSIGIYLTRPPKYYYVNGEKRPRKKIQAESYRLQVSIYQNHAKPLRLIREAFGGSMYWRESTGTWFLVMGGSRAERLLKTLRSYFVVKEEEVDCALEFQSLRKRVNPEDEFPKQRVFSTKMKLLKFRSDHGKAAL